MVIWSTLEPSLALPGRGVCWGVAEAFSISLLTAPPRQPPPEGTGLLYTLLILSSAKATFPDIGRNFLGCRMDALGAERERVAG